MPYSMFDRALARRKKEKLDEVVARQKAAQKEREFIESVQRIPEVIESLKSRCAKFSQYMDAATRMFGSTGIFAIDNQESAPGTQLGPGIQIGQVEYTTKQWAITQGVEIDVRVTCYITILEIDGRQALKVLVNRDTNGEGHRWIELKPDKWVKEVVDVLKKLTSKKTATVLHTLLRFREPVEEKT